ncbi:TonB-dependent receptor plug domain-containing protein [Spirosoma sp. HMF4905]|uniref:TonB-dependent receptor plug domain-containing protein n=1 Tax=Spirosoma arboris TaxID=2682092 RepID=A0A7K1S8S6_9BACT|nr:TonB-dependent receptor [Spirosoma arboris]MVM30016.1 TonB-dependent receptor plug domain-containing protein [Spirosoma arboris]
MKLFYLPIVFLFCLLGHIGIVSAQNRSITGVISDAETAKPLGGATVQIKGTILGTVTDGSGNFKLSVPPTASRTLLISMIGYGRQEITITNDQPLTIALRPSSELLDQVVVAASRVEESLLRSPVSIEKLDANAIRQSPSANYFEALNNVKGVDMVTSGLTYRQINTRGFNSTGNSRFLQLVDGMDNQSPGLGFAVGNLFGVSDIDVESAELIPGSASALYGPVAFNGLLYTRTKSPFDYQGLSIQQKTGINHVGDPTGDGIKPFTETSIRYAKAFGNRFAFKLNASYLKGRDWYASDNTDIDPNTAPEKRGSTNPGRDILNIYGDEVAQTLPGIGRVSRTGYAERDLTNYDVYSLKLNGAVHYRITKNIEAIYALNFSQGTANYTGSSRFMLNDFQLTQNRLELKGSNFFIRGYSTAENSNHSYNTRSLGQLINRTWVRDLSGNVVSPDQADATWFTRYGAAYNGTINGVSGGSDVTARAFADQGRYLPGSADFNQQKDRYIGIAGLQGAGVLSQSKLYHLEGLYDFAPHIQVISLQVGGNLRHYAMETNGTLFEDKVNKVRVNEFGAFIQASKTLLGDRLKLTVSGRYDKNQNFTGNFTPRASAVFSPNESHNFRASYQTGFRNPTVPDQFIKLNVGPIIILGGAPSNSAGLNAYENSFTAASVGAFGAAFGQAVAAGTPFPQAVAANKDKLVKSNVAYIRPEQSQSFEVGYKGLLGNRVLIDVSYYHGQYRNFLINQVVIRPNSPVLLADGTINPAAASDVLTATNRQAFQLYTNAADRVSTDGASAGLTTFLNRGYRLNANLTWAQFNILDANPNNIPAFNTPRFKTNAVLSNDKLTDRLGFSLAWHWQEAFDWYGTFTQNLPGRIPAYSLLDAQVNYRLPALKTTVKLGASNLTNNYVVQAYGSPAVGGLYYLTLTFDQLMR